MRTIPIHGGTAPSDAFEAVARSASNRRSASTVVTKSKLLDILNVRRRNQSTMDLIDDLNRLRTSNNVEALERERAWSGTSEERHRQIDREMRRWTTPGETFDREAAVDEFLACYEKRVCRRPWVRCSATIKQLKLIRYAGDDHDLQQLLIDCFENAKISNQDIECCPETGDIVVIKPLVRIDQAWQWVKNK